MASNLGRNLGAMALVAGVASLSAGRAMGSTEAAPGPARARARADSTGARPLPFLPAPRADDTFAASELTKPYVKNLGSFVRSRRTSTSLQEIERYAAASYRDTTRDSSNVHLVDSARRAELSPEERTKAVPKKPGAHVGIPGPAAAAGALLGGLALLVKVIAALVR